jgi:FdrA protein
LPFGHDRFVDSHSSSPALHHPGPPVSVAKTRVAPGTYVDSVRIMSTTRAMTTSGGVEWATAVMGTPANRESLGDEGFADLAEVAANDLVLAVRAANEDDAEFALAEGMRVATSAANVSDAAAPGADRGRTARTLPEARARLPVHSNDADSAVSMADVAVISVPGPYAVIEAQRALSAGLHVLLFSDNVSVADEVDLKRRAVDRGLLLMGPGAGTAMLGGTGLGFANVVHPGPVGIVAAAGTGAQEVMTLLDRHGAGSTSVLGVGGRDLSSPVDGLMTRVAVQALERDDATQVILIVSKPADPEIVTDLIGSLGSTPTIAAFLGTTHVPSTPPGVTICDSLESAVLATLDALGRPRPQLTVGLADRAATLSASLPSRRRAVRGLYSGGTLCYEALVALSRRIGPVYSNTPLRSAWGLPAPDGASSCLDLGEEEFTRERPHPMIDPEARVDRIVSTGQDPDTAVVLFDVVLGYGAHPDPAAVLAAACAQVTAQPNGPVVVAHVLGADDDPQSRSDQIAKLEQASVVIAPTGARAALLAAAVASRRPELAEEVA